MAMQPTVPLLRAGPLARPEVQRMNQLAKETWNTAWMARCPAPTGTQRGQTTREGLRSPETGGGRRRPRLGESRRPRWQGGAGVRARAGRGREAEAWEDLGTGSREQLWPVKSVCRPWGLGQLGSGNDCGQS